MESAVGITRAGRSFPVLLLGSSGDRGGAAPIPPPPKEVLAARDVIDVKSRHWPDLDKSQTNPPDGKISLQPIDEVQAAALIPQEPE